MSKLLPEIDHIAQGLSRTISQYRGKPSFNILCACYLNQVQHLESAVHASVDAWDVDSAVGWRLSQIGDLVGQPRGGENDDVYRAFVKSRIQVNRSTGKYADLAGIATALIPGYRYYELPSNVFFEVNDAELTEAYAAAVHALLQQAAGAGYRVNLAWSTAEPDFLFAPTGAAETDEGFGFCSTTETLPADAGRLAAGL